MSHSRTDARSVARRRVPQQLRVDKRRPRVLPQEGIGCKRSCAAGRWQVQPLYVDFTGRRTARGSRDWASIIRLRNGALSQLAEEAEHTLCFAPAILVEPKLGENADDALSLLGEAIDQPLLCRGNRITDARTYGRYVRATLRLEAQAANL